MQGLTFRRRRIVSLVVTMNDSVVSRERQTRLFELIDHAEVFRVHGDHDSAMAVPEFVPTLQRALGSVHERMGGDVGRLATP